MNPKTDARMIANAIRRRLRNENSIMRFKKPVRSDLVVVMVFSSFATTLLHVAELIGTGGDHLFTFLNATQDLCPLIGNGPDTYLTAFIAVAFFDVDNFQAFVVHQGGRRNHERALLSPCYESYLHRHLVFQDCPEVGYACPHLNCARLRINGISD